MLLGDRTLLIKGLYLYFVYWMQGTYRKPRSPTTFGAINFDRSVIFQALWFQGSVQNQNNNITKVNNKTKENK